jgi:hypothetical protein
MKRVGGRLAVQGGKWVPPVFEAVSQLCGFLLAKSIFNTVSGTMARVGVIERDF